MENIPDEKTCRDLMSRFAMLPNIIEHSYRVCQLSLFLGGELRRAGGTELNLPLVLAASLLHDLTKTHSLETRENHAETGGDLLVTLGYPEVAEIVRYHIRFRPESVPGPIREVHIVNYADKRVLHTRVVPLQERFSDLEERYGINDAVLDRIERTKADLFGLERRLFAQLDFLPARLEEFNRLGCFDLNAVPGSPDTK
jgi:uncharacterized protein